MIHEIIEAKRQGRALDRGEIEHCIRSYLAGDVSDAQMASFLMAVVIWGMTPRETVDLTRAMLESGTVLRFEGLGGPAIDKHSTGGVGDKVSLALLPLAVECGLFVPMVSGRTLGFTGGTLDKLESIPGMRTDLSAEEIEAQVRELGGCFAAQTAEIAPADRRIYALRDETGTVASLPLIVSSILCKKFAEGIGGVVIDVKCGRGAFMRSVGEARSLASLLEEVGRAMGVSVKTVLTAMDDPLGRAVGNALEVAEAIDILRGRGPRDCEELIVRLASEMLALGGLVPTAIEGESAVRRILASGVALERFERIVGAQGGRLATEREDFGLPRASFVQTLAARGSGYIGGIDARAVGETLRRMGGGRLAAGDAVDPTVGFVFHRTRGDAVSVGQPLCDIHAPGAGAAADAAEALMRAIEISEAPPSASPLILR